ncbi:MAG TPA: hypothetical protein VM123_16325 [archaeon]|nr:hypothetical protein [archaeon]
MADRYSTQNLNRTLTQFALENIGLGGPFVADRLAPVVRVPTTTGKYYKFSNTEALRDDYDALRAPKTESNEIKRSYSSATYTCQQYGLRELIADEEMDNADRAVIDPERDAINLITRKLQLSVERRVIARLMSTNYMTENGAATAAWNAESGVEIEADIDAAKLNVRKVGGVEPNTVVVPPHIAVVAKKDSKIRDLVRYTDPTLLVNGELPPRLFGLEVVIPLALYDEAAAGISAPSVDFAWDNNSVLVCYVERTTPSKRSISLAYQFRRPVAGTLDIAAYRYRDEGKHATVIEGLIEQTEEVVAPSCGYLITGAYS